MVKSILYSLFLILAGLFPSNTAESYTLNAYDFSFKDIDGNDLKFKDYKGKVLLIVNVASKCGFTGQYEGLQSVWDKYKDKDFVLIGIPSNDFYQEYKDEKDVKNFCELTFGVNFPMTSITAVRGSSAHPFYKWAKVTYGNKTIPKWNFHKILVNKEGKIIDTFSSTTKPDSKNYQTTKPDSKKPEAAKPKPMLMMRVMMLRKAFSDRSIEIALVRGNGRLGIYKIGLKVTPDPI